MFLIEQYLRRAVTLVARHRLPNSTRRSFALGDDLLSVALSVRINLTLVVRTLVLDLKTKVPIRHRSEKECREVAVLRLYKGSG